MKEIPVTLYDVLAARENRVARQREMLDKRQKTLISLTVVAPGNIKRTDETAFVARIADEFVCKTFCGKICERLATDAPTGIEILYAVDDSPLSVKRLTAEFENTHPLGRLMDIDVLTENGSISRGELGLAPRKCILCDNVSTYCIRAKSHSIAEINEKIKEMIDSFRQSQK